MTISNKTLTRKPLNAGGMGRAKSWKQYLRALAVPGLRLQPIQSLTLKMHVYPRFHDWKARHPATLITGGGRIQKEKLFQNIAPEVPITYVEFGVHEGISLRWWVQKNTFRQSRFYGFDSFKGLPENWTKSKQAGHFSTDGKAPSIDDQRVRFFAGLFHNTLPYNLDIFEEQRQNVIHMDADLFRSTLYPLYVIGHQLKSRDILIFDEFLDSAHEFRAFEDFISVFNFSYDLLAATNGYSQVALKLR